MSRGRSSTCRLRRPALAAGTIVLLWLLASSPVRAADDGGGRSVFATGAGNRALALGGAYAAVADDASAAIWNPAGLGRLQRKELQLTQTTLFGLGFSEQYASFVLPDWRWGALAATWRRFGVDGIEGRDERGFLVDDNLRDAETEFLLGYGRSLLDGDLALGGAFKVRHHRLAGFADSGMGLDAGLWLRPLALLGGGSRALSCGLAVRNVLEPQIKLAADAVHDPIALRAGFAWSRQLGSRLQLLAAADIERTRDMDGHLHGGLEIGLEETLALRVGAADGRLTAGAGLDWQGWRADYQFEDHPLGAIHRFGIGVAFGASVAQSRLAAQAAAEASMQAKLEEAFLARNRLREQQFMRQAQEALAAARWNDALTTLATLEVLAPAAQDLSPLAAQAWSGLARDQERQDELANAALSWRRALAATPDDAEAAAALARVQDESDRRARRGREIRARWEDALDALAAENLAEARHGFAVILELAPHDRDAASMLEHTDRALARRAATAVLSSGPASPSVQAAPPAAAAAPVQTAATGPTGISTTPAAASAAAVELTAARRREIADLYRRGLDAMQAGRRMEAVRFWELVWEADRDHEQVRDDLTREYLAQGMEAFASGALRQAVVSWEQAVRIAPEDPRARGYLERALQQLARMEQITGGR